MIKQIANEEYLLGKARLLETRNFKPGTDGMSASGAVLWIDINGKRLCRELEKGYYEPMPAVAFTSAKKNGGYRRLAKLTAIDSVVQYAVADAIAEICEAEFSPKSFAYRKGRGVTEAVELYCINARNYRLAAKIDPVACFDNIDYSVPEGAVADAVQNGKVMKTTKKYLIPVQNSAFEGVITESKLSRLKAELSSIIDPEHDSVIVYKLGSVTYAQKEEIGKTKTEDPYIL